MIYVKHMSYRASLPLVLVHGALITFVALTMVMTLPA